MRDVTRILRGHRANLDRYARLLATNLTELERQYIHQRIAEEHAAIARLEAQRFTATATASTDRPNTMIREAAERACHQ
jgi:hypothetical protein